MDHANRRQLARPLEIDPKGGGFKRGDDNPLDCDLLVVDETSMVDAMLMQSLKKVVPDRAALSFEEGLGRVRAAAAAKTQQDVIVAIEDRHAPRRCHQRCPAAENVA